MNVSFEEAIASILRLARKPVERVVRLPDAAGEVLSRDVVADRNIPPFHRATMDGFAIRWTGKEAERPYRVIGTVNPGDTWSGHVAETDCIKIMTGAKLPDPFDTVIQVEQAGTTLEGHVHFRVAAVPGQNIAREGEDARKGDPLVLRGTLLQPRHISTLAAVGQWEVNVFSRPSVAILAMGGELKEPWEGATGAFIRNSNAHFLLSALIVSGKSREGRVVLGLPGNPVAVIVHFYMLVRPLLLKATGAKEYLPRPIWLPLAGDTRNKGEQKKFTLGRVESVEGGSRVVEIPSHGSGDFVSASQADGVFEIPMGVRHLPAGALVRFYPILGDLLTVEG